MKKIDCERLSKLEVEFYQAFQMEFEADEYCNISNDKLFIEIPAKNKDFGDISIWFDSDEITVGIGENYHCHFSFYNYGDSIDDQNVRVSMISEVITYIKDIINDEIILEVNKVGDEIYSSFTYSVTEERICKSRFIRPIGELKVDIKTFQYCWSGKRQ